MTKTGQRNCEEVGKRVYEMIHNLCGAKANGVRAFVSQPCHLEAGKSKVSLTLIIVDQAVWSLFQEFAKERGLHEVPLSPERA